MSADGLFLYFLLACYFFCLWHALNDMQLLQFFMSILSACQVFFILIFYFIANKNYTCKHFFINLLSHVLHYPPLNGTKELSTLNTVTLLNCVLLSSVREQLLCTSSIFIFKFSIKCHLYLSHDYFIFTIHDLAVTMTLFQAL